jgi:hypothetical protein
MDEEQRRISLSFATTTIATHRVLVRFIPKGITTRSQEKNIQQKKRHDFNNPKYARVFEDHEIASVYFNINILVFLL